MRKYRKISAALLAGFLAAGSIFCTYRQAMAETAETVEEEIPAEDSTREAEGSASGASAVIADAFSESDGKNVTGEEANAEIVLDGDTGTISDTTRGSSGSAVTITAKGIYHITGSAENVSIVINDEKESGNIYLILDNVQMTNEESACIVVEAADKVIIQCVGENSLTYTGEAGSKAAAIYAKDDLTVNGEGSLTIESASHGIICSDDMKITGAELDITAERAGIKVGDSLRIGGGVITISSGRDGIQAENDTGDSWFYIEAGELSIEAGYDGIDVGCSEELESYTARLIIAGGKVNITAGGGSDQSKSSENSQKGLKCQGDIVIAEAETVISSADDAIHSDNDVTILSGSLEASSSDDGIHADNLLSIEGGQVLVSKAYEGLEACEVLISGGETSVYSSDDGINAAGGSDSSSSEQESFGPWGTMTSQTTGSITVRGGSLYVNAQGDGLDSNGSLYISGGLVIIEGPAGGANGALDIGDGAGCVAEITGGTVLAIGCADMAVNFNSGSQCSALVSVSGSAGDEITVDDGSGFRFTATKSYSTVVYSSPELEEGESYTLSAGGSEVSLDFSSSMYYSTLNGGMNGTGPGGMR